MSHAEDLAATKFPKSSLFSSTSVLNDHFGVRLTLQSTSKGLHLVFPASSVVLIQVIEAQTSVLWYSLLIDVNGLDLMSRQQLYLSQYQLLPLKLLFSNFRKMISTMAGEVHSWRQNRQIGRPTQTGRMIHEHVNTLLNLETNLLFHRLVFHCLLVWLPVITYSSRQAILMIWQHHNGTPMVLFCKLEYKVYLIFVKPVLFINKILENGRVFSSHSAIKQNMHFEWLISNSKESKDSFKIRNKKANEQCWQIMTTLKIGGWGRWTRC